MHIAYLLTGGNMGNREAALLHAMEELESFGIIKAASGLYETAAWGNKDQPSFLNQALCLSTDLQPTALLQTVLSIEKKLGRHRGEKYGPRVIDIDILFYDDVVINEPGLHVPHPHLQHRRFALACLVEIAPHFVHPVLHKNVRQLWEVCTDPLPVKRWK